MASKKKLPATKPATKPKIKVTNMPTAKATPKTPAKPRTSDKRAPGAPAFDMPDGAAREADRKRAESASGETTPAPVPPPLPPPAISMPLPPLAAPIPVLDAPAKAKAKKSKAAPTVAATPTETPAAPIAPTPHPDAGLGPRLPPFSLLVSNIKGLTPERPVALPAPITIVYSPANRAGKTAVLDAARLALTGRHPVGSTFADLCDLGPQGRAPAAMLLHPPDAMGQYVSGITVMVPQGKRTLSRQVSGAAKVLDAVAGAIDVASAEAVLTASADKLRELLFQHWGAAATGSAELRAMPGWIDNDAAKKLWTSILGPDVGRPVVAALTDALLAAKEAKRDAQGAARAAKAQVEELTGRVSQAGILLPTAVAALEAELASIAQSEKLGGARFELELAQQQLATLPAPVEQSALDELTRGITECESWLAQARAYFQNVRAPAPHPHAVLRTQLAVGQPCPVCEHVVTALPAQEDSALRDARQQIATVEARLASLTQARDAHQRTAQARAELTERAARLSNTIGQFGGSVIPKSKDEVAALRAQLTAQQATLGLQRELEAAKTRIVKAEVQADLAGRIGDELRGRLDSLIGQVAAAATQDVGQFVPAGFAVQVDRDAERGLYWRVRGADEQLHVYLAGSGVERAIARVAVACALAQGQAFRCLLLDDEELGAANGQVLALILRRLIEAVENRWLDQVLIASTRAELPNIVTGLASSTVALVSH